ncbi:MAG TPA: hypothetical protein VGS61_03490 [Acidimicrobiales bacterium]|nr:hypothetical protein [Acidimicrobiales bacterium]
MAVNSVRGVIFVLFVLALVVLVFSLAAFVFSLLRFFGELAVVLVLGYLLWHHFVRKRGAKPAG